MNRRGVFLSDVVLALLLLSSVVACLMAVVTR